MSTSLDSPPSASISKQEFLSSLPRWRQFLAKLNWHPVVEYEIRSIERKQRMKQLQSENARLAELNSRIDALLFSSDTSSTPPSSTDDEPST